VVKETPRNHTKKGISGLHRRQANAGSPDVDGFFDLFVYQLGDSVPRASRKSNIVNKVCDSISPGSHSV
jgi:hypothetical protein